MMKSNRKDGRFYVSYSANLQSNNTNVDNDIISLASLNMEAAIALEHLSSNINSFLNRRLTSTKHFVNSIIHQKDSNGNYIILNGTRFDEQLFQLSSPVHVVDHTNTSTNLNQLVTNHNRQLSGSSKLDNHLFKLAFVVTLSEWYVDREYLLGYCPERINILNEIPHYKRFCFPELNPKQTNGGEPFNDQSTYVFVRTQSDGQIEYGYCRRLPKNNNPITQYPIVICIVSNYSCFKLYDAILTELATAYISNEVECNLLLKSFYSQPLPVGNFDSTGIACLMKNRRVFYYTCPSDDRLNHDYFLTLLSCLSPTHIVHLFESILLSKRILIFSNYPSKLTKCCLALSLLIYPFTWPYLLVPLMPSSLLHDLIDSPCPFIYGCLYDTMEQVPLDIDNDTIHVDLDLNKINHENVNANILPGDLRCTLISSLEYLAKFRFIKLNPNLINIAISEACLYVFTELFYHLPHFLKYENDSLQSDGDFSICSNYFTHYDSGIDLQSIVSIDSQSTKIEQKEKQHGLSYEFNATEFLNSQSIDSYKIFLSEFMSGMIFLKFLDDYQQSDGNKIGQYSLFKQRLNERRHMKMDDLVINPLIKFQQTFDLFEKQIKQMSKQTNQSFSKFLKNILNKNS